MANKTLARYDEVTQTWYGLQLVDTGTTDAQGNEIYQLGTSGTGGGGSGGTVTQGTAAALSAPWPVALSDGTNLLGTELHPLNVNEGDLNSANDSVTAVFSNVVPVALASPPTATNAGSATTLKWATDVNHFSCWNASGATVYVDWTGGTAGVYSWPIAANSGLIKDVHVPAAQGISVYTAGATFLNTSTPANATNNLVLIGEL